MVHGRDLLLPVLLRAAIPTCLRVIRLWRSPCCHILLHDLKVGESHATLLVGNHLGIRAKGGALEHDGCQTTRILQQARAAGVVVVVLACCVLIVGVLVVLLVLNHGRRLGRLVRFLVGTMALTLAVLHGLLHPTVRVLVHEVLLLLMLLLLLLQLDGRLGHV